jgi:hypothetical protein
MAKHCFLRGATLEVRLALEGSGRRRVADLTAARDHTDPAHVTVTLKN